VDRVTSLLQAYWEAANEKGPHLEQFVRQVRDGRLGDPPSAEELRRFLEAVRDAIIDNIETRAGEGGPWAMMKDQVVADTHAEIDDLIARYAPR